MKAKILSFLTLLLITVIVIISLPSKAAAHPQTNTGQSSEETAQPQTNTEQSSEETPQPQATTQTIYTPSSWAVEKVAISNQAGITPKDFELSPYNENITRLDFFKLIINICELYGIPLPELNESKPFSDTQEAAAGYAYMLGLSQGTSPGIFSPEQPLTREMAAVVISRIRLLFASTARNNSSNTSPAYPYDPDNPDHTPAYPYGHDYSDRSGYARHVRGYDTPETVYKTPSGTLSYASPMDTRQADRVLKEHSTDSDQISEWAKANMADVYSHGLLTGAGEGKLEPKGNITREQAVILSVNVLAYMDESKLQTTDADKCVIPAPVSIYISPLYTKNDLFFSWNAIPSASAYDVTIYKGETPFYFTQVTQNYIDFREGSSAALFAAIFDNENKSIHSAIKVVPVNSKGVLSAFSMKKEFTIKLWESLNELITGNPDKSQFSSKNEADKNMVEIKINVWNLDAAGTKFPSTRTLKVNKNVAEDVKNIFEEIFNGKEKFPIKNVSSYSYRNGTSQHSNGTAIDINPNENYFILSNGKITSGTLWKPGVNPYSINPNGDVVRAFNKYGWHWSPDMNWPNGKDYMHFSLLGI